MVHEATVLTELEKIGYELLFKWGRGGPSEFTDSRR